MQRLADEVAGRFAYGVMAASAATFLFWSTMGVRLFPQVHCFSAEPCKVLAAYSSCHRIHCFTNLKHA